jgi:hypothetical protein
LPRRSLGGGREDLLWLLRFYFLQLIMRFNAPQQAGGAHEKLSNTESFSGQKHSDVQMPIF